MSKSKENGEAFAVCSCIDYGIQFKANVPRIKVCNTEFERS